MFLKGKKKNNFWTVSHTLLYNDMHRHSHVQPLLNWNIESSIALLLHWGRALRRVKRARVCKLSCVYVWVVDKKCLFKKEIVIINSTDHSNSLLEMIAIVLPAGLLKLAFLSSFCHWNVVNPYNQITGNWRIGYVDVTNWYWHEQCWNWLY